MNKNTRKYYSYSVRRIKSQATPKLRVRWITKRKYIYNKREENPAHKWRKMHDRKLAKQMKTREHLANKRNKNDSSN